MKKTLIAIAVCAASAQASAVEIYNQEGTTFDIGGHVSVGLTGSDSADASVNAVSPRINFNATHDLGNGFTADAKGEWALNYLEGGEETFTTRLGYIGLTHDQYGRAVVGTQWAPYYDVAGVADKPIAFANDFIYTDHGVLGTGRADKMVSYRNALDLGNAGKLSLGLGWQGDNTKTTDTETVDGNGDVTINRTTKTYGDRAQAALTYAFDQFTVGYVHNTGNVDNEKETFNTASASYGSYGNGLYVAGVYQIRENKDADSKELSQEALIAYAFENSLNLSVNYENQKDDINNKTNYTTSAIQAEYNFTSSFVGYSGYQFDLNNEDGHKKDDKWMFGVRYYL